MPTKTKTKKDLFLQPRSQSRSIDFDNFEKPFWVPIEWVYPKPGHHATTGDLAEYGNSRTEFKQSALNKLIRSIDKDGQEKEIEVMYRPLTPEERADAAWDRTVLAEDEAPLDGISLPKCGDVVLPAAEWGDTPPCLMILTGETRHRAMFHLKQRGSAKFVRVFMRPLTTGAELDLHVARENTHRSQISITDEALLYQRLRTVHKMSIEQIMEACDITDDGSFRVAWRLKLLNLSDRGWEIAKNEAMTIEMQDADGNLIPRKFEFKGDRLRTLAEICERKDANDKIGYPSARMHAIQDAVLDAIEDYARQHGSLMSVGQMKQMKKALLDPAPKITEDEFNVDLPDAVFIEQGVLATIKKLDRAAAVVMSILDQEHLTLAEKNGLTPMIPHMNLNQAGTYRQSMAKLAKACEYLAKRFDERIMTATAENILEDADSEEFEEVDPEELRNRLTDLKL